MFLILLLIPFFFASHAHAATSASTVYLYVSNSSTTPTSTPTTTEPLPSNNPVRPSHPHNPQIVSFTSSVFLKNIILLWNINSPVWYQIPSVRILRSTEGYPSDPLDGGKVIYEGYAAAFIDRKIEPNVTYFYSLFIKNPDGTYSAAFTSNEFYLYNPANPFPDLSLGIPNEDGGSLSVKVPFDNMFCENKYANLFCKTANGLFIKFSDQNQPKNSYPFFIFLDALVRILVPWWWLIIIIIAILAKIASMIFRRR